MLKYNVFHRFIMYLSRLTENKLDIYKTKLKQPIN
jgi:hypothetical protein